MAHFYKILALSVHYERHPRQISLTNPRKFDSAHHSSQLPFIRPLKSLPVREKTGDVFQHPDIPIFDLEDLVKEAMASRTPGDISRGQMPPVEIKRAWDCDTKINPKPM